MLDPSDYICPVCGLVLPALAAYHRHWQREHVDGRPIRQSTIQQTNSTQPDASNE